MKNIVRLVLATLATMAVLPAIAQDLDTKLTSQMGITQKMGAWLPTDARFKDENGKSVTIGDIVGKRPIVLMPIFYSCKTMCVNLTDGICETVAKGTKFDEFKPGRDVDIVMLSINPKETPDLAMAKKVEIFNMLTPPKGNGYDDQWRADAEKGWHLLTGSYDQIRKVTDAVGFKYRYDEKLDLINHPTVSIVVTKSGQVSSYIIGPTIPTSVLKTDLALATNNEIGVKADQSFMFGCIMLDPTTGKYTMVAENIIRLGCVITLLIVVGSILIMSLRERQKHRGGAPNAGKAL
jgi:protein SCO1/2